MISSLFIPYLKIQITLNTSTKAIEKGLKTNEGGKIIRLIINPINQVKSSTNWKGKDWKE